LIQIMHHRVPSNNQTVAVRGVRIHVYVDITIVHLA
jgi:hypothetical protein